MRPVGLTILAAGGSTRLGQPKQLVAYRGRSLLRHAAEVAIGSLCRPIVVVLGAPGWFSWASLRRPLATFRSRLVATLILVRASARERD